MQIILYDQTYSCKNEMAEVEKIFQILSQMLIENGQRIASLEIDGVEVFTNYDLYINDHLESIQIIFIKVITDQELLEDSLLSVKGYLERAVPEIDKLVDQFYHEVTAETWKVFAQLLEGLQYVMGSLGAVSQHEDWFHNIRQFALFKAKFTDTIVMLQNAAESQDRIWLCDVLLYEIIPVFKSLSLVIDLNFKSGNVQ